MSLKFRPYVSIWEDLNIFWKGNESLWGKSILHCVISQTILYLGNISSSDVRYYHQVHAELLQSPTL